MDGGWRQRRLKVALSAGFLALAACGYAALVDNSGFESAALSPDAKTLVVAYHQLSYRPASGLNAFPDGGIARYDRDRILLAKASLSGDRLTVVRTFEAGGMPGTSHLTLRSQPADPAHMLLILTDQPSTREMLRIRRWRLGLPDGALSPLPDLERELAAVGQHLGAREFGDLRLAAEDGSLLLGVSGSGGDALWVRTPAGGLRLLDPLTHFYGQAGDEVYLWSGDQALVHNWRTGARRVIARYDPATRITSTLIRNDPTVTAVEAANRASTPTASIAPDRQSISVNGVVARLDLPLLRR
jgi:hypothetical protein